MRSHIPGIRPMIIGVLRLAWDIRLLTPGMVGGVAVDSGEVSEVAFSAVSWEDGWAIAWPDVMPHPPKTNLVTRTGIRLVGVGVSTTRPVRISRATNPQTSAVAVILVRSETPMTSREGEAVSNGGGFPARRRQGTRRDDGARGPAVSRPVIWHHGVHDCRRG